MSRYGHLSLAIDEASRFPVDYGRLFQLNRLALLTAHETVTNMDADSEKTRDLHVIIGGMTREGRFGVMSDSVIVYYQSEIKFEPYGTGIAPETVARGH